MKTFDIDCFHSWILDYRGTPVIIEDCHNGEEFYSELETYGSHVFDIKNNKYLYFPYFIDACPEYAIKEIDTWNDDWKSMDDDDPIIPKDDEAKARYLEEIKLYEKLDPRPKHFDLKRYE